MRLLIIAARFPPHNSIGAIRAGKLARLLHDRGHEVRVLTADSPLPRTAAEEVPEALVTRTTRLDVNRFPAWLLGRRLRAVDTGARSEGKSLRGLRQAYRAVFNLPDGDIGWYPFALRAGERMLRDWRPDVIYATAMPYTGLMVADRLSRRHGIPWIAEFRDLWTDYHYYDLPGWRRRVDAFLEKRCLRSAAHLVTVSEPLAEQLRQRHAKSVSVVMNGFDPEDFPPPAPDGPDGIDGLGGAEAPGRGLHGEQRTPTPTLRLLHTGMIYPGRRDPTPLFQAMRQLASEGYQVEVDFYGRLLSGVGRLAEAASVAERVRLHEAVPYKHSLALQQRADVLLLLSWDNPAERGVYSGKLFEYLGARRPILVTGFTESVAADLVRARKAGAVARTPEEIAAALRTWSEEKRRLGRIPSLPAETAAGLSRAEQFSHLLPVLEAVARQPEPVRGGD